MSCVTIVVPTFNAEEHIEACIESIYHNLMVELESGKCSVIVKDGGSSDRTVELLNDLTSRFSWLDIHVIHDKGVYDAMNQAVSLCKTSWIYFLGADDRIVSGFNHVFSCLDRDVLCERVHYFDVIMKSGVQYYNSNFSKWRLLRENVCHQGIIYPVKLLQLNPYSLSYKALADWALNISLFDLFVHHNFEVAMYNDETGLSNSYVDTPFLKDRAKLFFKNHGFFWGFNAGVVYLLMVVKRAVFK